MYDCGPIVAQFIYRVIKYVFVLRDAFDSDFVGVLDMFCC